MVDERAGSRSELRPVSFTKREIQVLQGLVNGDSKKQISKDLGIPVSGFNTYTSLIAEKCSESIRTLGLRKAIVIAVRHDLLDLSSVSDKPILLLSDQETRALAATLRGVSTGEASKAMNISDDSFLSYRANLYRKIGVVTVYQAVAFAAREVKRLGGELSFVEGYFNYIPK